MRKKNAGALFMDFHISPDDRVGGALKGKPAKPRAAAKGTSTKAKAGNGRQEPQLDRDTTDRSRGTAQKPQRGKAKAKGKTARGRREKRPFTFGRAMISLLYWGFMLAVWGGIAVAGVVIYYAVQLPSSDTWAVPARPANIRIVAADGQLMSNRGKMGGEAVALRELPYYVPAAFLAIEDRRFYDHIGIDPMGIGRAVVGYATTGHITGGGSTITQQLAKNLFLSPDQNMGRKVQEALLSLWLERNYTKDDILELYLNRVFFGNNSTGIEAAAQTYFGKSARNLSLGEAAILAGSVQAPSVLNPKGRDPALVAARQKTVLQVMADQGYISVDEAKAAAILPDQKVRTKVSGSESYVADWVESLMHAYIGDMNQDVVVYTTINWDLQKQAEFVVKEAVAKEGEKRGFAQAALVSMDVDGTVRAMVGGVDYAQSQYNRAVTARRQSGSAFKPIVYLAAMEKGYTPDTIADDSKFDYEGWSPANANNKYRGPVTLREALADSLNTVAGRLAIDIGPAKIVETAQRLGISSPLTPVPSMALGTNDISLLELTAAYAPFANGGYGVIANVITRIETSDGKVLYQAVPAGPGQVIAPEIVGEMNDMLQTALEIGTGKKAQLNGWPIAGKTGTSQKARDALFVGYTARMVTGVWLGNDDDTGTTLSGGNVPVEIWSEFMQSAHQGLQIAELPGAYAHVAVAGDPGTAPLQPMEQPPRSAQTIGDLLGQLFGGGN